MEAAKHRALVRALDVVCKQKEKKGASLSAPKDVTKGLSKRKGKGKDDRPFKKGLVFLASNKPKKSSPLKPSYGVRKGLMTLTGFVTQGSVRCLLTRKEHAVELIEPIIKDKDIDPYAEQTIKELGVSGLFDLFRVRPFFSFPFSSLLFSS